MINVIIVDDHDLLREGIKFILSQMKDVKVVGEAANGKEFIQLLEKSKLPDIVLLDITMPEMDGIDACQHALRKYPKLKIITLSMHDEQEYYFKMIQAGAKGFVLKQAGKKELEKAIREVYSGGSHFPEDILREIIFKFGTAEFFNDNPFNLSKREIEVLALICQGNTNSEMAEKLFLSPKTIEGHRSNLLSKTGTKNSAHLVMFAIKKGIIKL
ncbi:MAG: response regulator transcription factor [Bacteroidota bacterium]